MRNGYAGWTRCWEEDGTALRQTFLAQEQRVRCLTTAVHGLRIRCRLPGVLHWGRWSVGW